MIDVELAVQVVELVLEDRREEALGGDALTFSAEVGVGHAYAPRPLDETPQARDRQATFPVALGLGVLDLDLGIDAHGQRLVAQLAVARRPTRNLDDRESDAFVDLRGGEADAAVVVQGVDHVGDQAVHRRTADVLPRDLACRLSQGGVPHANDLAHRHDRSMRYRKLCKPSSVTTAVSRTSRDVVGNSRARWHSWAMPTRSQEGAAAKYRS